MYAYMYADACTEGVSWQLSQCQCSQVFTQNIAQQKGGALSRKTLSYWLMKNNSCRRQYISCNIQKWRTQLTKKMLWKIQSLYTTIKFLRFRVNVFDCLDRFEHCSLMTDAWWYHKFEWCNHIDIFLPESCCAVHSARFNKSFKSSKNLQRIWN